MLSAYTRLNRGKEPFAGCISLSGWLPMRERFLANPTVSEATPLFWAHGQYDEDILVEQQVLGSQKLRNRGINVTTRTYPVGHESFDEQEIREMTEFLDETLFPKAGFRADSADEFFASVKHIFDNNSS